MADETEQQPQSDVSAAFTRLLERTNNDAVQLARQLYAENHEYRAKNRDLQGQVPAAGSTVLTEEQAQAWAAYQQLGPAQDVQTALTERQQFQQELATLRQESLLRDVAGLLGYEFAVLKVIGAGLDYVVKTEQASGKAVQVVYVKDGETEVKLDAYAATHWQAFLPALRPQSGPGKAMGTPPPPPRQPVNGQQQAEQQQPRRSMVRL